MFWNLNPLEIFSTAVSLFILLDPIGNIPAFLAILKDFSPRQQRRIIFREMMIALVFIIAFSFLGEALLSALHLQKYTLLISGGIILFLIAIRMIFPVPSDRNFDSPLEKEPFIVPLAIPLVAGPAVLAAVMLYASEQSLLTTNSAILIAWGLSLVILLASSFLKKILGQRGLIACERLMGLILTLLSVQMFLQGLDLYLNK